MGVLFGIFAVDAVNASRFHQHVGAKFESLLCRRCVRRNERCAGAACQDDNAAFLEVTFGSAADVGFGYSVHLDGAGEPCLAAERLERVLQR